MQKCKFSWDDSLIYTAPYPISVVMNKQMLCIMQVLRTESIFHIITESKQLLVEFSTQKQIDGQETDKLKTGRLETDKLETGRQKQTNKQT
jgi:hypothetical protein